MTSASSRLCRCWWRRSPHKLFEAIASERPVLASVAGEGAPIVSESGAGLVVPLGDARAIAPAVLDLGRKPAEERGAIGRRGGVYVREGRTGERPAAAHLEVLVRAAGRKGASG